MHLKHNWLFLLRNKESNVTLLKMYSMSTAAFSIRNIEQLAFTGIKRVVLEAMGGHRHFKSNIPFFRDV